MNNDYFDRNKKDMDTPGYIKNQQFFPGGFPTQQPDFRGPSQRQPQGRPMDGPPFGPPFGPPQGQPQGPGQGPGQGPPTSPPPNFTPELPRMEGQPSGGGQPFSGPSDFSAQRGIGGGAFIFGRPRNFRGCLNRFTYIWLINGNNFWFYPIFVGRNAIEGFRWRRNRWEYDRININRILFFRCF